MIRSCAAISAVSRSRSAASVARTAASARVSSSIAVVAVLDHRLELARMPELVAELLVASAQEAIEPHHLARFVVDALELGIIDIGEKGQ